VADDANGRRFPQTETSLLDKVRLSEQVQGEGRGGPQGGENPGEPGLLSETGKPIGCGPNRPGDETPEARPRRSKARRAAARRTRSNPDRGRRRVSQSQEGTQSSRDDAIPARSSSEGGTP